MKNIQGSNRTGYTFRRFYVYLIITFMIPFAFEISARINLPQISKALQIAKEDQDRLRNYFTELENNSNIIIDKDVEKILLNILNIYDSACSEMISYWGSLAEGTANLNIRIIFISENEDTTKKYVLLGIRCYSNYHEYGGKYCDERLAALLIDSQNTSIILLPHAEDCTNCPELSRIEFDRIVHKKNPLIISLAIITTNDNPCCGGPYQYSDERVNYYAFLESGVKQVASIVRYQAEYSHDEVEGDYSKIYKSNIRNELNSKEGYTQIISEYIIQTNGVKDKSGSKYYVWNPEKEKFELIEK